LGEQKAWHYQHHVEDANCNPKPMSLLHAFVRDDLAARTSLRVPSLKIFSAIEVFGELVSEWVTIPAESFDMKSGQAEQRGAGVQPDVVYELKNGLSLALEVKYTHAVDLEKQRRLQDNYHAAVELDVSDLPAEGISREQLETILAQSRRWQWLVNPRIRFAESRVRMNLEWAKTVWRAGFSFNKTPQARPPTQKLKQAKKRLLWAEDSLLSIRHRSLEPWDAAIWLGEQHKTDRVAIACAAMKLDPEILPAFMQQSLPPEKPPTAFGHHPYSWQPPLFMKFCLGSKPFSAHDAGEWSGVAMPDRCETEEGKKSLNGYTRTAAALQMYFLQLQAQGLLTGSGQAAREERTFTPRFAAVADLHAHLRALGV